MTLNENGLVKGEAPVRSAVLVLTVLLVFVLCLQLVLAGRVGDLPGRGPLARIVLRANNRLALIVRALAMIAAAVLVLRQPKVAAALLAASAVIALVTRSIPMGIVTATLAVMAYYGAREVAGSKA